jgi:hypothetical protein
MGGFALLAALFTGACSRDGDKPPATAEDTTRRPQEGVPLTIASEDGVPIH